MEKIYAFVYFIILLCCEFSEINAIKCFICGPKSYEPFKRNLNDDTNGEYKKCDILENLLKTEKLSEIDIGELGVTAGNDLFYDNLVVNEYIRDCPEHYVGCLTQTDANHTTRTCEMVQFNECQMANGVTYCYCSTNLCNKEKLPPSRPHIITKQSRYDDLEQDDEDLSDEDEASGDRVRDVNRKSSNSKYGPQNKNTGNGSKSASEKNILTIIAIKMILIIINQILFQ